jgi:hypothetical protein
MLTPSSCSIPTRRASSRPSACRCRWEETLRGKMGRKLNPWPSWPGHGAQVFRRPESHRHHIGMIKDEPGVERTIVGVVSDMKFSNRDDVPVAAMYLPYAQAPESLRGQAEIKVNTLLDPAVMIPALRNQVRRPDAVQDQSDCRSHRCVARLVLQGQFEGGRNVWNTGWIFNGTTVSRSTVSFATGLSL